MPILPIKRSNLNVTEIKTILGINLNLDSKRVIITPEQARLLLDNANVQNRDLSTSNVNHLAKLLRDNEWKLIGDGISFDNKGVLTNGQHRLSACVKVNKPIEVFVTFGVERSTAIDTGKKRSFSDNVKIGDDCDERIKDNELIHKIFHSAYIWRNPIVNSHGSTSLSADKMVALMNKYADELIYCFEVGLFKQIQTKGCNSVPIKATLFIAYLNGVDIITLKRIVDVLQTGVIADKLDTPIISLRDKLMSLEGAGREVIYKRIAYTNNCIYKLVKEKITKTLKLNIHYTYDF